VSVARRLLGVAGAAALALGSSRATAAPPDETAANGERPATDDTRSESWLVPTLHGLGLMTGMRIGAAVIWPDPFADTDLELIGERYERAYTLPPRFDPDRAAFEWDGDPWYVNTVGHALFGSELHLRARTCRKNVLESLAFTAIGSAAWEYGFEANAVRPSALDLVYTPAMGLVLGEARYAGWQAASRIEARGLRGFLMVVLDPFGEFERALGTAC
jgi:hypothetical protein